MEKRAPLSSERTGKRRYWRWAGFGLAGLLVTCIAYVSAQWYRYHAVLSRARREIDARHFPEARAQLARLSRRWSGQGEPDYLLGICELESGHPEAALAAWEHVPARSPFGAQAVVKRAQLCVEQGRLAEAERILDAALGEPRPGLYEVRRLLVQLLSVEGRQREAARATERSWNDLSQMRRPPLNELLVVLHGRMALDLEPVAIEGVKVLLDNAAKQQPDDDRVWLGRANWAIRTGRTDDAERWLTACLRRRPTDAAVWQAALDLAQAIGSEKRAHEAVQHLPADSLSASEALLLHAWFAARRGERGTERTVLNELIRIEPGNMSALERLAVLAAEDGEKSLATTLRERKAKLDQAYRRYQSLFNERDPDARARELARLADTLGRRFEAMGFATVILRRRAGDPEAAAILARNATAIPPAPPRRTLADSIAPQPAAQSAALANRNEPAAGGFEFVDQGSASGLSVMFTSGETSIHQLPTVMSGGLGLLDYDGDGLLDVYVLHGGTFPRSEGRPAVSDRLFRNLGAGVFEDVTEESGIGAMAGAYGHGVAVGDFDNDGYADLFMTRWRAYALYRNRGDGTFEDITARAQFGGDRDWPTSAAWADFDNDGDLDLYVCHYLTWDADHPRLCPRVDGQGYTSCDPRLFTARADHVFRNDGGRFTDVTSSANVVDPNGRGLGVLAADLDDDGQIDVFVANDGSANYLFRNRGGFHFEEAGHLAGVAANAGGGYQAGMGVAAADVDGNGSLDLAVTNFYGESTTLFQNLGDGVFADRTVQAGLAASTRYLLGFGTAFFDADNDRRVDLMTANGHVGDYRPLFPYGMPAQILRGCPGGRFADVSRESGSLFSHSCLGRGLVAGDLDNDGRIDALVVAVNEPLLYFHNKSKGGHFITLYLEGRTSSRDGVGAKVSVISNQWKQSAQRVGGGSYESAGDSRLHFGLGASTRVDSLEIRWPSGAIDRYQDLPADTGYLLREGNPVAVPPRILRACKIEG